MILMSKYKGQHGGKRVNKFGQGSPPPHFSGIARKKTFFLQEMFPYDDDNLHNYLREHNTQ